jgi:hypothetical protein
MRLVAASCSVCTPEHEVTHDQFADRFCVLSVRSLPDNPEGTLIVKTKFYVFSGYIRDDIEARFIGTDGGEVAAAAIQWADGMIEGGRDPSESSIDMLSVSGRPALVVACAYILGESGDLSEVLGSDGFKYEWVSTSSAERKLRLHLEANASRIERNKRAKKGGRK